MLSVGWLFLFRCTGSLGQLSVAAEPMEDSVANQNESVTAAVEPVVSAAPVDSIVAEPSGVVSVLTIGMF